MTRQLSQERKTIAEKKSIVQAWTCSKSSMKNFCQDHQISLSSLKYWRQQFNAPSKRARRKKDFVSLHITSAERVAAAASVFAEIVLLNGTRLIFHRPVDSSLLKAIMQ